MLVEKRLAQFLTLGKLFSKNSKHWKTMVDWLKDGANKDPEDIASPKRSNFFLRPHCLREMEPHSN